MKNYVASVSFSFVLIFLSSLSLADELDGLKTYLGNYLSAFHSDPSSKMDTLPDAIDSQGKIIPRGKIKYLDAMSPWDDWMNWHWRIEEREIMMNWHKRTCERNPFDIPSFLKTTEGGDVGGFFSGAPIPRNIQQVHVAQAGSPEQRPWPGPYWPTHKGILGHRYADQDFPNSKKWETNFSYVESHSPESYIPDRTGALSPAEKYDLLIGNRDWSLAEYMWEEGRLKFEEFGVVATWQGICHGLAAAAHFGISEPQKPVTVVSTDGTPITFHRGDIKALVSWLWAISSPPAKFVGTRCRQSNPERDRNGRILSSECFDSNPGAWHLTLAHQVGNLHRGLVMDSTYDAQVWNYSVTKYRSYYFNPRTSIPSYQPNTSLIPIEQYTSDKFRSYRSPEARYVVGVVVDVSYLALIPARHSLNDPSQEKTIRFVYDLELNQHQEIIGGEWYTNGHPDFIWSYRPGSAAVTATDNQIGSSSLWEGSSVPSSWLEGAVIESKRGRVLSHIVNELLRRSL